MSGGGNAKVQQEQPAVGWFSGGGDTGTQDEQARESSESIDKAEEKNGWFGGGGSASTEEAHEKKGFFGGSKETPGEHSDTTQSLLGAGDSKADAEGLPQEQGSAVLPAAAEVPTGSSSPRVAAILDKMNGSAVQQRAANDSSVKSRSDTVSCPSHPVYCALHIPTE